MLMPKRVKRRKQFRGTMAGKALRGNKITYGEYGLVAAEPCWIKSNQIEAVGYFWILPTGVSPCLESGHARAFSSRAVAAVSCFPFRGSRDLWLSL